MAKRRSRSNEKMYSLHRHCALLGCHNQIINRNKFGVCTQCWNERPEMTWDYVNRQKAIQEGQISLCLTVGDNLRE